MLIESMLYSQIYKIKFDTKARSEISYEHKGGQAILKSVISHQRTFTREISVREKILNNTSIMQRQGNAAAFKETISQQIRKSNPNFQYASFLRLRNMIFLCLLLKTNPSLRKFRHHYLLALSKSQPKPKIEIRPFSDTLNEKLGKILMKAKEKLGSTRSMKGSTKSVFFTTDSSFLRSSSDQSKNTVLEYTYEREENVFTYPPSPPLLADTAAVRRLRRASN